MTTLHAQPTTPSRQPRASRSSGPSGSIAPTQKQGTAQTTPGANELLRCKRTHNRSGRRAGNTGITSIVPLVAETREEQKGREPTIWTICRQCACILVFVWCAAILAGCADFPSLRIEQAIPVDQHVQVIVSTGTRFSVPDSPPWLSNLRYYLIEYSLEGPTCPPALPLRAVDLNAGLAPLTQKPGLRIDFFLGASADRVVRVVRQGKDNRQVRSDIAVLGPGTNGRWQVLDSWSDAETADRRSIIPSIDGRFLVFTRAPMRVLDTRSMKQSDAPADVIRMVDAIFAVTKNMPADFLLTEDLMGLQAAVRPFQPEPAIKIRECSLEILRGSSEVTEHGNDEMLIYRQGRIIHTKWADWINRHNESFSGTAGGGPLDFGIRNYAWDLDAHTLCTPQGTPPACWNAKQLWIPAMKKVAVFRVGSSTRAEPGLRAVDLSFPFAQRGKEFHFVGMERSPKNKNEKGPKTIKLVNDPEIDPARPLQRLGFSAVRNANSPSSVSIPFPLTHS